MRTVKRNQSKAVQSLFLIPLLLAAGNATGRTADETQSWHQDHAGTARISILPPFENDTVTPPQVIGKKPIPNAQLGLQAFGRLFPHENLRLDYALTVSNGRGPADSVVDYDDNKGLGLRLRLTYSNPNVEAALGGYGYFGEYTDKYFSYWNEQLLENYKE